MMRTVNQFSLQPILEIFSQKSFHNSFHLFSHKSAKTSFITWLLLFSILTTNLQNLNKIPWDLLEGFYLSSCKSESRVCYLKTKSVCIPEDKMIPNYHILHWLKLNRVKNYHFLRHNIWLRLSASSQKSYSWIMISFFFFLFLKKIVK